MSHANLSATEVTYFAHLNNPFRKDDANKPVSLPLRSRYT